MARVGRHLRGNVVAYVALFVALGLGTAYAVERNSVQGKHIAKGAVRGSDIRDGTIGAIEMEGWPVIAFDEPVPCNINGGVPSNDETRISWTETTIQNPGLAGSSDCQAGPVGVQVSRPPYEDGIYLVTANVVWEQNGAGTRTLQIYSSFGGTSFESGTDLARSSVQPTAGDRTGQSVSEVVQLTENQEVFATAYQTSGGDLSLTQGSFSVAWLSGPPT